MSWPDNIPQPKVVLMSRKGLNSLVNSESFLMPLPLWILRSPLWAYLGCNPFLLGLGNFSSSGGENLVFLCRRRSAFCYDKIPKEDQPDTRSRL